MSLWFAAAGRTRGDRTARPGRARPRVLGRAGRRDAGRVHTAAADGFARAHDLRTGREAWSHRMVSGDLHRVTTVSGTQALDAATGAPRSNFPGATMYPPAWSSATADGSERGSLRYTLAHCFSAPAMAGDTLVVGDQDGVVRGIRLPAGPGSCE